MSTLTIILIVASVMLGVGVLAVVVWFGYTSDLNRVERRLARRKGMYRELVGALATRERALLEPEIHRIRTLLDFEALEAVLQEPAHLLGHRFINYEYLWAFLLASLGYGVLVNVFAVLVGAWRFRLGLADRLQRGLLPFRRRCEVLILLAYAVLENVGYRQLTLFWRLRGLWDAWRGKTGWEKFARVGFREGVAPAHG